MKREPAGVSGGLDRKGTGSGVFCIPLNPQQLLGRGSRGRGLCAGHARSWAGLPRLTGASCLLLSPVPAMITSHPNTTIAIKGHAKELNCTARGERPIIIRWEKGDTVIDPDRVMRYAIATKDNGDEVVSTLKVSIHAPASEGPRLSEGGEPTAIVSVSNGGKGEV